MSPNREAAANEAWRRTLSAIPTIVGRLVYLASLRDANSGTYQHFGLAQRVGEGEVDRMVRRSHISAFQEWLSFGLERQREEMDEYISSLEGDRREILANWLTLKPYSGWVPAESRDVERRLFHADMGVTLETIRIEYGVAVPDPDA